MSSLCLSHDDECSKEMFSARIPHECVVVVVVVACTGLLGNDRMPVAEEVPGVTVGVESSISRSSFPCPSSSALTRCLCACHAILVGDVALVALVGIYVCTKCLCDCIGRETPTSPGPS